MAYKPLYQQLTTWTQLAVFIGTTMATQQIPTICNATFNNTESPLSYHSSNKTRTHLMDFATAAMEWLAYPSAHARHSSVHGCVGHGLGNSLWQSSLLWSLVLSRTPFPYHLQGTSSCGQSSKASTTIPFRTHLTMYG